MENTKHNSQICQVSQTFNQWLMELGKYNLKINLKGMELKDIKKIFPIMIIISIVIICQQIYNKIYKI